MATEGIYKLDLLPNLTIPQSRIRVTAPFTQGSQRPPRMRFGRGLPLIRHGLRRATFPSGGRCQIACDLTDEG